MRTRIGSERRRRERAGVAAAPLGLGAAVVGWSLSTPLADSVLLGGWQLILAALAAGAAILLGTVALGPATRPGFWQAFAALLGVVAGVAALAGLALIGILVVGSAT